MSEAGAGALMGTSTAADYAAARPAPGANSAAPLTPETAAARLEAIKADPAWVKAFSSGDIKATSEHAELFRVIYANANPQTQADARAREERSQLVNQYRAIAEISDDVARRVIDDTPVTAAERERVSQLWQRLSADAEWRRAWLSGDRQARTQKTLIDIVMARPVIEERSR